MAAATYAETTDVNPLLGNLAAQRSAGAISNAIDSASTRVNLYIGRTSNVDSTDKLLPLLKQATRYLAAVELLTGVQSQDATRESLRKEAMAILDDIGRLEQSDEIQSAIVETSEPVTWPANPNGEIYSANYRNLRKQSSAEFALLSNMIITDGDYAEPE